MFDEAVSLLVFDEAVSAFKTATAIMNFVVIATFFDEISEAIFDHFIAAESNKNRLFEPVLIYFGTIETNGRGMLHFYCLI